MKKFIKKFELIGICEIHVDRVVKAWTDKFSISRYENSYKFVRQYRGANMASVQISEEQANEVINRLKLLPIQSSLFRFGVTYRSKDNILREKERIMKVYNERVDEISVLKSVIREFEGALNYKNDK
jgi:hypothetical protein